MAWVRRKTNVTFEVHPFDKQMEEWYSNNIIAYKNPDYIKERCE